MPSQRHATTKSVSVFLRRWLWSPWSVKSVLPSRNFLMVLAYVVGVFAVAFSYYFYLNALYLVDEVLDGDALRELTLLEKTTIYVHAPSDMEHLKRFVLHYSICPTVHEIKIRSRTEWRDLVLDDSLFKYTKTHSLVTFEPPVAATDDDAAVFQLQAVATEGVFYLDADVFVSCDDVAFTHSVWRSASDAPVGYFPRAHSRSGGGKDTAAVGDKGAAAAPQQWQLLGWRYVATQGAYSVMLSAAAMVHKKFVVKGVTSTTFGSAPTVPAPAAPTTTTAAAATAAAEREGGDGGKGDATGDAKAKIDGKVAVAGDGKPRPSTDRIGLVTVVEADKLAHMKALGQALARAPCQHGGAGLAVPVLAAALGAAPPVWVDVPYELKKLLATDGTAPPPAALRDACLTELAAAVRLQTMPYSWHKATKAKDYIFW